MPRTADALIILLAPHYNSAAQYCRGLYRNSNDAQDGLQDAILSAIKHFGSLRDDAKFKSWFFTIITRTFYNSRRKQVGNGIFFIPLQERHLNFPELYNDDDLGEREMIMLEALSCLGEKERAAILLFEIAGLSLQEIMKLQEEKSLSAIKSRLSRTRLKLRTAINEIEKIKQEKRRQL